MPTDQRFSRFPAYPDDIKTYDLSEISYFKLLSNDADESLRLFQACRQSGFFSLDLSDSPSGISLLRDVEELFDISEHMYSSPEQHLDQYPYQPPQDLHG